MVNETPGQDKLPAAAPVAYKPPLLTDIICLPVMRYLFPLGAVSKVLEKLVLVLIGDFSAKSVPVWNNINTSKGNNSLVGLSCSAPHQKQFSLSPSLNLKAVAVGWLPA